MESLSKVGAVLSDSVKVGSPPVTISQPSMAMDIRKDTPESLITQEVKSDIGGCKIDGQLDMADGGCVTAQVRPTANRGTTHQGVRR